MKAISASSRAVRRLSIAVGIIAALIAADIFTSQYNDARARLDYLCSYRLTGACDCAAGDASCHSKCAAATIAVRTQCEEELQPSYYKLQDKFTWQLLIWLPLSFGAGMMVVRIISRIRL